MELLDSIESGRFVGREFLVWLWFESEVLEGRFQVEDTPISLWFEATLTLEAESAEREQSRMRGAAPTMTSEAHEALRRAKLPTQARLRIERGEQAYGFVLAADTLTLTGATLPALVKDDEDERFYERMYLLERLENMVDSLYGQFLGLRLTPTWETDILPAIRKWVANPESVDAKVYRQARSSQKPISGGKRLEWSA